MAFRYSLVHHPLAAEDFRSSLEFFESIDPDLAALFEEDFKAALRSMATGRSAGTIHSPGSTIRWVKLKRFSHKIYFEPQTNEVRFVLGVVSSRRHPKHIDRALRRRKKSE